MRADVVLILLVTVVRDGCYGYYQMDYSEEDAIDFYDMYDSDVVTTPLLTTTETQSDIHARIRRFGQYGYSEVPIDRAILDPVPITPTLSSIPEFIVTRSNRHKDNEMRNLNPEEVEEIKSAIRDMLKGHEVEKVDTTPILYEDRAEYEQFEDKTDKTTDRTPDRTESLLESLYTTITTSIITIVNPGIQWKPERLSEVTEDQNKNVPVSLSGKRIHAHRAGGSGEENEDYLLQGHQAKTTFKADSYDYGSMERTSTLVQNLTLFPTAAATVAAEEPVVTHYTTTPSPPNSQLLGNGDEGGGNSGGFVGRSGEGAYNKIVGPVLLVPEFAPKLHLNMTQVRSRQFAPTFNGTGYINGTILRTLSPNFTDKVHLQGELKGARQGAPSTRAPVMDIDAIIAIIANLTYDYEWNLTEQFNKTLLEHGVPTCPTPSTISTTTTTPPAYDFANTSVVSKCFVCGLKTPGIPRGAQCSDAFAGDFLPLTPVDARAKGQIAKFRKYCRFLDVHNYVENPSEVRSIYGRFTGGCAVRWTDLSGVYTQRTCRNRFQPVMGRHFASKRMAKLELALVNVEDGCIITPMASLLALSRGISLYARFHACVCTGSWCNKAIRVQHWKVYWTMLLHWFFNR
ncbi:unnamed protein product [Chrysodeixis includens]|uniref:Protein Wnt n=1 Tax=Chrysodeixis includens TaxID=689277 RepID=A0A9P0BW69_CHRIL|nr:unnamed protein product [Chrysodeixis includens]